MEKPQGTEGKLRPLTKEERTAFLAVAKKHHRGMMFRMTYHCGLRPGEVRALKWGDVDFAKNIINVKNAIESGKKVGKDTKSESGVRSVPIPLDYAAELKAISKDKGLVFPSKGNGQAVTERGYSRSWKSFKRLIDIEMGAETYRNKVIEETSVIDRKLTPYYLRHTYCTELAEKGIDLKTAQYLMGHADVSVTANIYTHVSNDMLKKAKEIIQSAKDVPKRKLRVKNLSKYKG